MTYPSEPNPTDVAIEAGVSYEQAAPVVAASWKLADAFTGRDYQLEEAGPHVVHAVFCLAAYQLIHSPGRREFRVMQAADSTLTREALGPLFRQSGAGILLASEVLWNVATDTQEESA